MAPRRRRRGNIGLRFTSSFTSSSDSGDVSPSLVFISSTDDEEANRDLSLDIVDRSKRRRLLDDEKPPVVLDISPSSSEHADTLPPVSVSAREGKVRRRTRKRSRIITPKSSEEEKLGTADTEVTKINADDILGSAILKTNEDAHFKEEEQEPLGDADANLASNNIVLRKLLRGPRYFDEGDRTWSVCYNCGEEGHRAIECTLEKQQKPCFICGVLGHAAKGCPQAHDCYICNRRGHFARDCPNKHRRSGRDPQFCLLCGDLGHVMQVCRNDYAPEDLKEIRCYVCGGLGHLCCFNFVDDGPMEASCYNCGQSGHIGSECAKSRNESTVDTAPMLCYKCGGEHFARECMKAKGRVKAHSESRVDIIPILCHKCGEGHIARECSKAKLKRWMLDSPERENRHTKSFRSHSSYFEKKQRNRRPPYERNKSTPSGKSRIKGGWIVYDPDYRKTSKENGRRSSPTSGRKGSKHWLDSGRSQGSSLTPGMKGSKHGLDSGRSLGPSLTPLKKSKHWLDSGLSQYSYNGKKHTTHLNSPILHSCSESYRPATSTSKCRSRDL